MDSIENGMDVTYSPTGRKFVSISLDSAPELLKSDRRVESPPIMYVRPGRYEDENEMVRKVSK